MAAEVKWTRALRIGPGMVEYSSKDGRAKIIKNEGESPVLFYVYIDGEHWADGQGPKWTGPSGPPGHKLFDGWWRLKDVKAAVAEHLAGMTAV